MSLRVEDSSVEKSNVGDIVDCYVDEIHLDKNKVSLSLINPS